MDPPSACACVACSRVHVKGKSLPSFWRHATYRGSAHALLCSPCANAVSRGQTCPHCGQVYRQRDADGFDGKEWLECSLCIRWVHVQCDEKAGRCCAASRIYKARISGEERWYMCPGCRGDLERAGAPTGLDRKIILNEQRKFVAALVVCESTDGDVQRAASRGRKRVEPDSKLVTVSSVTVSNGRLAPRRKRRRAVSLSSM